VSANTARILTGPPRSTLFFLALPVLTEQILNTLVGLVDVFLAGQISATATSAVGVAAYVTWLVSMLVMLVGIGASALVSRAQGAGNHAEANHFANQAITLAAVFGCIIALLNFLAAPLFATAFKMTGEAYEITVTYLRIESIGHFFVSTTIVASAAFRGIGRMKIPMLVFGVMNVVNAFFSVVLMYGWGPAPRLGVNGIVAGTVIAQFVGCSLIVAILIRGQWGLRLHLREMALQIQSVTRIVRIGLPAAADGAIMWTGQFIFLLIIARLAPNPLGQAYLAAHIIAVRFEAFTYLPAVAWGAAVATMIGQSLGAGDIRRAVRAGNEGVLQCGSLAAMLGLVYFFAAPQIYRLMSTDPLVQEVGTRPFRYLALLQPLLATSIVYIAGLRGAGDTRYPLLISLMGAFCVRVPLGYFFGVVLNGGLLGAWVGMFGDMIWRAVGAIVRYHRGRWVHTKV
jgi:multidrug resistance protein, MATE family